MPINYKDYPPDWKTRIRPDILKRAKNRCEFCGARNYALHPITGSKVILTIAHLDQDISNNEYDNLAALCQRCHNIHDMPYRLKHRAKNRRLKLERAGQQKLFDKEKPSKKG